MPQKNFIYLSTGTNVGGTELSNISTIYKTDVKMGTPHYKMAPSSGSTFKDIKVGSETILITVSNGSFRPRGTAWAINQRDGSPISGYNLNGTPNFGQGQMATNIVWPADTENSKTPTFNFIVGNTNQLKNYNFTSAT